MKRQMILAVAVIFMLALFAPAVSYSAPASTPVVKVENKEKKEVSKTETTTQTEEKAEAAKTETKACCDKANKEGCCKGANKSETKSCTGEKKACCESKKTDK